MSSTLPPERMRTLVEHHAGSDVRMYLTDGSVVAGHLIPTRPGPDVLIWPHDGAEERAVPISSIGHVEADRPKEPHPLARYWTEISDAHWDEIKAAGLATSAVVAVLAGLPVLRLHLVPGRHSGVSGGCSVGASDAHLQCAALMAAAHGILRSARERGYHDPMVLASLDVMLNVGIEAEVRHRIGQGLIVWPRRADQDIAALLEEPGVWEAVSGIAARLVAEIEIDPAALADHLQGVQPEHRMWSPA